MNTFGRIFKVSVFGESHGAGIGAVVDGVPAGEMLPVFDQMFNAGYTPYYDIRYEYEWEELKKDNGYGYYYSGEPERGYHRYN